jgi:hypothetical protein
MTSTLISSHLNRAPAIGRGGAAPRASLLTHGPPPRLPSSASLPRSLAPAARAPAGTSRARPGSRRTLVVTAVFERFSERSIKSVMVRVVDAVQSAFSSLSLRVPSHSESAGPFHEEHTRAIGAAQACQLALDRAFAHTTLIFFWRAPTNASPSLFHLKQIAQQQAKGLGAGEVRRMDVH